MSVETVNRIEVALQLGCAVLSVQPWIAANGNAIGYRVRLSAADAWGRVMPQALMIDGRLCAWSHGSTAHRLSGLPASCLYLYKAP